MILNPGVGLTLQPFIIFDLKAIVRVIRSDLAGPGCRIPDLHRYIAVVLKGSQAVSHLWFRVQPLPDVGMAVSAMHLDAWWWRWRWRPLPLPGVAPLWGWGDLVSIPPPGRVEGSWRILRVLHGCSLSDACWIGMEGCVPELNHFSSVLWSGPLRVPR